MASPIKPGTLVLDYHDLIAAPYYLNSEQTMLSLLHDKGAPVKGILYFSLDYENYNWEVTTTPFMKRIISWIPKTEAEKKAYYEQKI